MINLSGKKRVLITGASGAIGTAIATLYRDRQWEVFAHYRLQEPDVPGVTSIKKELTLPDAGRELVEATKPHLVINCAADQSVFEIGSDAIHQRSAEMFALNVFAPLEIMKAASLANTEVCINISSIEAERAKKGHALYGASKAALESLTRSAALELAPMRVIGLRLGLISRPGIEESWPEGVRAWIESSPSKRMGTPSEVARAVAALASDDFAWTTGSTIDFDGGFNAAPGW